MENNSQAPNRRGRPAGSKNKRTKEVVTNPSGGMEGDGLDTCMGMGMGMGLQLKILEVAVGCDIIAAVCDFANRCQLGGVSVISTHGLVRDITVYQPNMPSPFLTYNGVYKLLCLRGNFYGSSSSIRPPSPFSTCHIASFLSGEGNLIVGLIQGKLNAASNVFLCVSVINGTESVKLPLPHAESIKLPLPRSESAWTETSGLPSGTGRSRMPVDLMKPDDQ